MENKPLLSEVIEVSTKAALAQYAVALTAPLFMAPPEQAQDQAFVAFARMNCSLVNLRKSLEKETDPYIIACTLAMLKGIEDMAQSFFEDVVSTGIDVSADIANSLQMIKMAIDSRLAEGRYEDDIAPKHLTYESVVNAIRWEDLDLKNPTGFKFKNFLALSEDSNEKYGDYTVFKHVDGGEYKMYNYCRNCYINLAVMDAGLPHPGGPAHTYSSYCKSGKKPHCTCDSCY